MQISKKAEEGILHASPLRLFLYSATIFFLIYFAFSKISAIVLRDENDVQIYAFKFDKGDSFAIRFVHSVNLTPIEEIYRIGDFGLELQDALFEDFKAWHSDETGGQKMELADGKVKISGINRPVLNLTYRVGQVVANHTLIINGKEIPLNKLTRPGGAVSFKLTELPRWKLMKEVF